MTRAAAALTLLWLLAAGAHAGENRLRLSLTTDYLHRGLLQTSDGPAYQALLERTFDSGFYLGAWASRVEYGPADGRSVELDYFAGYGRRLNPDAAFDVTVIRYTFPGGGQAREYDWNELIASAYLGERWLVSVGVADNWISMDELTVYSELGFRQGLPLGLTADATVGRQWLADPVSDYSYGELGLARSLGPVTVRAAFAANSGAAKRTFGARASSRWVLSVSWATAR